MAPTTNPFHSIVWNSSAPSQLIENLLTSYFSDFRAAEHDWLDAPGQRRRPQQGATPAGRRPGLCAEQLPLRGESVQHHPGAAGPAPTVGMGASRAIGVFPHHDDQATGPGG